MKIRKVVILIQYFNKNTTFRKIRFTIHFRDESMNVREAKCEV